MDFVSMFFSVLFAFFVKDIYDIFAREHIIHWLKKSKEVIDIPANKRRYDEEEKE